MVAEANGQYSLRCYDTDRWVERLRECLEPALAAEVLQRDEQLEGFGVRLKVSNVSVLS